jgi:hypothetical protein
VSLSDDDEEEVEEVVADKRDRWTMQRVNDWLKPWVNYLPKRILKNYYFKLKILWIS